ncbi:MAG: hypothetical protein MH472_03880 [Bacteroidia bacterium]|nr:hypothetical protein [Bacteroidia bacterium]
MAFGEHLKSVKNFIPNGKKDNLISLSEILKSKGTLNELKDTKGLYGIWLKKDACPNFDKLNFKLSVKSKSNEVSHKVVWNWNKDEKYIPLYIGKSTVIGKRLSQHLGVLSDNNWFLGAPNDNLVYKKNSTSNQFRAGLEQLLRNTKGLISPGKENALDFFKDSVFIKIIKVDNVEDRFYLEDFSIGYFQPWFNIDAER